MSDKDKPKRHHHHVWKFYLRPWTCGGAIWCLQNRKIFTTGTTRIAVEKDFYKFRRLAAADEMIARLMFARSHPAAQRSFESLQDQLMFPFRLIEMIPGAHQDESLVRYLDEYTSNVLEELHSGVEARFIPLLQSALRGDISFYEDERCIAFLDYLTKQYMRTKGIKERVAAEVEPVGGMDLRRAWSMLSFMFAQNIGASLFQERKRRRLVALKNATDIPFITGDQPMINLHANAKNTTFLSIYYPLSPEAALWLGEIDQVCPFPEEGLAREHVKLLNQRVANASYKQIFASEHVVLESIMESTAKSYVDRHRLKRNTV